MTLLIREMTPADVGQVAAIEAEAGPDPWSEDLFHGEFSTEVVDGRHWLVAVDDRGVAGFGGSLRVTDELHIMNLAVAPARRRRGMAGHLLARLLLDGLDRGAVDATLEVRAGNVAAVGLYHSFGFGEAGRRDRYYPDGEDAIVMWLRRLHFPELQRLLNSRLAPVPPAITGGDGS